MDHTPGQPFSGAVRAREVHRNGLAAHKTTVGMQHHEDATVLVFDQLDELETDCKCIVDERDGGEVGGRCVAAGW